MTAKNLIAFYEKIVSDPALQERLRGALVGVPKNAIAERVANLATESGFAVSTQEVESAMREIEADAQPGSLSDADLAAVTGGAIAPNQQYASGAKVTYGKIVSP